MLPARILVDAEVEKVIAEAENGSFCLLPRHVDFVAALVPGLLTYESMEGKEVVLAVDAGVLVKCGQEVKVSTRQGVVGPDLGKLRRMVEESFKVLDDKEKMARAAAARIEAGFVRRFKPHK